MIFTLALWAIAIFILYSNSDNKTNKWIAICFLISSIGTFKEFMMDRVVPILLDKYPHTGYDFYLSVDSCLTAFLYLASPLAFITVSLFFAEYNKLEKHIIPLVQFFTCLLIAIILIIYDPINFKYYQLHSKDFWYVMSSFNIGYVVVGCIIMFRNVRHEFDIQIRRRKRIIMKVFLVPYFFWLFSIFIIHTLDISGLKKVWKDNVYLIIGVLIFYLYMAYKEGFMGLKVSFVKYDWNSQMKSISSSTQYINHMLKNHANKISWSIDSIRSKIVCDQLEELDIIERTAKQLVSFTERTNKFLSPKVAGNDLCGTGDLIFKALEAFKLLQKCNVNISVDCQEDILLKCDAEAVTEVIYNLLKNSSEAILTTGNIIVTAGRKNDGYCIEIIDDGIGITKDQINQIFQPFYTTKKNNINFGIGLSYCKSVMQAHDGSIHVSSQKGLTSFMLYFPKKRIIRKEAGMIEQNNQNFSG